MKRANLERFIIAVREDLVTWWDKCYISEDERRLFTPFTGELYTENVLNMLEEQAEKLKYLYNNNKEIFNKVGTGKMMRLMYGGYFIDYISFTR